MRKLRMGMIGGGSGAFIGPVHRRAAELDGGIELVAGALSSAPDKARASARAVGLDPERSYGDWQDMLARETTLPEDKRLDLVAIVTPNHLHFPVASAFAGAGFHVMCEKPATRTVAEAEALCATLARSGTLFGLCHVLTGYPMIRQARALVAEGALGRITRVVANFTHGGMTGAAAQDLRKRWRADPERSGLSNAIADIGTHCHNLIGFVTGLVPQELCADLHSLVPDGLDNEGAVLVNFAGGARGTILVSQLCAGEVNNMWIKVHGTEGSLEWRHLDSEVLWLRRPGVPAQMLHRGMPGLCAAAERASRLPAGHPEGFIEAFATLYADFADAIRRGASAATDVPDQHDGLRGMRFVSECLASGRNAAKWTVCTG